MPTPIATQMQPFCRDWRKALEQTPDYELGQYVDILGRAEPINGLAGMSRKYPAVVPLRPDAPGLRP